jgi:CheY-like chemotaxis protein
MIRTEMHGTEKQPMNVLIVDDDADSASLVVSVFNHLGCHTVCTMTPNDAQKGICSLKANVIILDWILSDRMDAKAVTDKCSAIFSKYDFHMKDEEKPKIVTYSSLKASEIEWLTSPYFYHVDHWQKPISQRDLLKRALNLLWKLEV